jgi:hypothetical protein
VKRVDGAARAKFTGIMLCGHIWSCPVCSRVLRAKRAAKIEAAVRGMGGSWVILTATFRHRHGGDLALQLRGLMTSWRKAHQGNALGMQRIWADRVSASVRATEVTHSRANGFHPHLHVLMRSKFWSRDARATLQKRWERAVVEHLGERARPTARRGLHWSCEFDSEDTPAHYLTKLGLEVSGAAKEGRGGSRSHWQLAMDAAKPDAQHDVRLWREFVMSTKGRQAIRLDPRAESAARTWLEATAANARALAGEQETADASPVREVELWPDEVQALRWGERHHPALLDDLLADAEQTGDPAGAMRRALQVGMPSLQLTQNHDEGD